MSVLSRDSANRALLVPKEVVLWPTRDRFTFSCATASLDLGPRRNLFGERAQHRLPIRPRRRRQQHPIRFHTAPFPWASPPPRPIQLSRNPQSRFSPAQQAPHRPQLPEPLLQPTFPLPERQPELPPPPLLKSRCWLLPPAFSL